jgi:hypothetical protein
MQKKEYISLSASLGVAEIDDAKSSSDGENNTNSTDPLARENP